MTHGVKTDVLAGLDAKQPKVVAGSISCLDEIIQYVPLVESS